MASHPTHISDRDDPRLAPYRNVRDADLRGGGGRPKRGGSNSFCMVESALVIRRLLTSTWITQVDSLFLSTRRHVELRDAIDHANVDVPVYVADEAMLREVSGYRHHGGALCLTKRPPKAHSALSMLTNAMASVTRTPCVLILVEGVTNIDNIGTIFRNAAAFGATGVVLRDDCADPLFRKAIRVSMGHVFRIPWSFSSSWCDDLHHLRHKHAFRVIAAETLPDARPLDRPITHHERVAIVLGGEAHGVRSDTLARCDEVRVIPMVDESTTSLNVGVACAIFLYEFLVHGGQREIGGARVLRDESMRSET